MEQDDVAASRQASVSGEPHVVSPTIVSFEERMRGEIARAEQHGKPAGYTRIELPLAEGKERSDP
jgi:hypothetical protein